ncbi:MAG: hypothetical protein GY862_06215 [Gammaproteobacteria bacterium]|nr:hypothetical protein [Gammaproteobacteria bacterium]
MPTNTPFDIQYSIFDIRYSKVIFYEKAVGVVRHRKRQPVSERHALLRSEQYPVSTWHGMRKRHDIRKSGLEPERQAIRKLNFYPMAKRNYIPEFDRNNMLKRNSIRKTDLVTEQKTMSENNFMLEWHPMVKLYFADMRK